MYDLIIPLLCCFITFSFWFISSIINKSAVSPAALFCGYWFFEGFVLLIVMIGLNGAIMNLNASYTLITSFAFVVFITSAAFSLIAVNVHRKRKWSSSKNLDSKLGKLYKVYWVFLILGFPYSIILYIMSRNYFGISNILLLPGVIAHSKYIETWSDPSFLNLFMMSIFISAILAGFLLGVHKCNLKRRLILSIWIVPAISSSYMSAARSAFALTIVFWLASYICARAFMGSDIKIKIRNVSYKMAIIFLLAFSFIHVGYMFRHNVIDFNDSKAFLTGSVVTLIGNFAVIEDWIQSGGLWTSEHQTIYTFAGTAQLLGIGKREGGMYRDTPTFNFGNEVSQSNIYTAFRPLIDDLGIAGALIAMGVLSLIASISWFQLRSGKISGYPLILFYNAFVLWSPITSIYAYNTTIGAVVISSFFIIISLKKQI